MGTRLRGVAWVTFLGQPVLAELGGAAGLRSRLHPAYRELARVLEPWLYHEERGRGCFNTREDLLRWERRFID